MSSEQANEYLRTAYETLHAPPGFITRILRTPPTVLWSPTPVELRTAHYTTGEAPAAVLVIDHGWPPRLTDLTRRLAATSDEAVVRFGAALSDLVAHLQSINPEACWAFAHEGPDLAQAAWPEAAFKEVTAAEKYLADATDNRRDHPPDAQQGNKAMAELIGLIHEGDLLPAMQGLRPGADHAVFCPSLRRLLEAALALPERHRASALRAMLSSGNQ
jgi:hypothetical protein